MKKNQNFALATLKACIKQYLNGEDLAYLSKLVDAKATTVDAIMETQDWKKILEFSSYKSEVFDDIFRICDECGGLMTQGFYDEGCYYCSEECLPYDMDEWKNIVDGSDDYNSDYYGRESYWTDWYESI